MRITAALLIALLAIMGIAAATVEDVIIISPHDGDTFNTGDTVKIKSQVSGTNDGPMSVRTLINGERVRTSMWVPTKAGEYTITVEAADDKKFTDPIWDSVTIIVN